MTKVKKAIITTVIVLVMLAFMIFGIILIILHSGSNPQSQSMYYEDLRAVMEDDITYLSDSFFEENDLIIRPEGFIPQVFGEGDLGMADVIVYYDARQISPPSHLESRVKGLDNCEYYVYCKGADVMQIETRVSFTSDKKSLKYFGSDLDLEHNGYRYCLKEDTYSERISFYAVTKAREKKDCLFSMSFILYENEWEKNEYTYSDLKTRAEQLFKSALENIECYSA